MKLLLLLYGRLPKSGLPLIIVGLPNCGVGGPDLIGVVSMESIPMPGEGVTEGVAVVLDDGVNSLGLSRP